jgi:hypothetical protein
MRPVSPAAVAALLALASGAAAAEENYERWPILENPFESTGGGGVMIGGYDPVVVADRCTTDFTATEPNGTVPHNVVEFDALPMRGGILCTNGRWRAREGSASGTTPLQVFIKDGVTRRSR